MKTKTEHNQDTPTSESFLNKVLRSLVNSGAVIPETAQEVQDAEARFEAEPDTLPSHLQSADEALKRAMGIAGEMPDNLVAMPVNQFAEIKEELRRAARNGEKIAPSVAEKMRQNRRNRAIS